MKDMISFAMHEVPLKKALKKRDIKNDKTIL
jgi:hypothetical protein